MGKVQAKPERKKSTYISVITKTLYEEKYRMHAFNIHVGLNHALVNNFYTFLAPISFLRSIFVRNGLNKKNESQEIQQITQTILGQLSLRELEW